MRLWSSDGSFIKSLPEQSDGDKTDNTYNHLVSFSSDGKLITSVGYSGGSSNYTVKFWSRNGKLLNSLTGGRVYGIVNPKDDWSGKVVAIASRNHAINLWHLDDDGMLLLSPSLDELMRQGCDWVRDYLKTNINVKEGDRTLCDDIPTQK